MLRALRQRLDRTQRLDLRQVKSERTSRSPRAVDCVVRLRAANSGCEETSVVTLMFGSWRAISTPSLVETRSGSM